LGCLGILAYSFPYCLIILKGATLFFKKQLAFIPLWATMFLTASSALADIYRCPADNGTVTLSNVEKGGNCKKMVLPPPDAKKPSPLKTEPSKQSPSEPKVVEKPKGTYESAAAERKRIIQEEIDLEKVRLSAVQARIKDMASIPNKTPDQLKDMVALQQKEILHTSNLQLLQKELNK
jgi:hypothetical protein